MRLLGVVGMVLFVSAWASGAGGEPRPLVQAHAHNDYEHARPLFDALDRGFCSVEADVYLVNGELLVAHEAAQVRPERTLTALYLDPLRERVKKNGGRVYPGGPTLTLLVDVKSEAGPTYAALDALLQNYKEMLSSYRDNVLRPGAVSVIVSGNRAREAIAAQSLRYVSIDGRRGEFDSRTPVTLVPWVSMSWDALFAWKWDGPMPAEIEQQLLEWTTAMHVQGRLVRFWGTPDRPDVWRALLDNGVDWVSTDNLDGLRDYFGSGSRSTAVTPARVLKIMPLGDSITRGSYLAHYAEGPRAGQVIGLPNPLGGGYRKPLQDKLRAAGIRFDFVGDLNYDAYGRDGIVDSGFDPDHQGLAGFSNQKILDGGVVPTPPDVLASLGVETLPVQGIIPALEKHQPDVILLMSGANGFDPAGRDKLIATIGTHSSAQLLVATITTQKEPRKGWEQVTEYNRSLRSFVEERRRAGQSIAVVEINAAVSPDELLPDGVHPNQAGLDKIAEAWFKAIQTIVRP